MLFTAIIKIHAPTSNSCLSQLVKNGPSCTQIWPHANSLICHMRSSCVWMNWWIDMDVVQNLVHLVNIKIAGKWMFIPLELIIIVFDPPPYELMNPWLSCTRKPASGKRLTSPPMIFLHSWGSPLNWRLMSQHPSCRWASCSSRRSPKPYQQDPTSVVQNQSKHPQTICSIHIIHQTSKPVPFKQTIVFPASTPTSPRASAGCPARYSKHPTPPRPAMPWWQSVKWCQSWHRPHVQVVPLGQMQLGLQP